MLVNDQIVLKKCIHGDLHNGNWGITLDQQSIVLYDFGYIYELPNLSKDFVVSLLNKNACSVSEKILELFSIPKSVQNLQSIQDLLENYQSGKKFFRIYYQTVGNIVQGKTCRV